MSTRNLTLTSTPKPHLFNDAQQAITELADLEVSLGLEMQRLQGLHAPKSSGRGIRQFRGKDLWWWRFRLVEWAYSPQAEFAHPSDILAGLRLVLKDFSDQELIIFLSNVSADPGPSPAA